MAPFAGKACSGARQHVARRYREDAFGGFAQLARFAVSPQGHDGVVTARAARAGEQRGATGQDGGYQTLHGGTFSTGLRPCCVWLAS